ncbi:glycosyl hydrolase 115 family protein [Wenyingzhuangia sp. IMCC45467]
MLKSRWFTIIFIMIVFFNNLNAQTSFTIVSKKENVGVFYDKSDAKVVEIAAKMLVDDIRKTTTKYIEINGDVHKYSIIAGTVGESSLIDRLIDDEKIEVSDIEGKWETYKIELIEKPLSGIDKALVIVGSDRRATAYGLLEISRKIGVSPWEWWADVTPEIKETLSITVEAKTISSPSVKYRGVFLNDEDWGLQRWSALNYEPETGDIGPKTYAKVFELLLRLRANTIWPAMHKSTKAFYHYPENKEVANNYAIVVGSSHAEPMLSNINAEWDHKTMGEYRYDTNSKSIKKFFKRRAKEIAKYDGIYTVGMRGEHDSPMIVGEDDTESQVALLEEVITDQREILEKYSKDDQIAPQVFVPYKEVLHYYQSGLELPEDVTLMWTDDNYGYIRQLSNNFEQKRSGGAGVYYHTSYWGRPHDYLWLNSTNPTLMWEEMSKAYEFQSRDLWILNCGDIKPHEYNMELFLDMAWDMSKFKNSKDVKQHRNNWATREFGKENAEEITNVLLKYDELAFKRRPEFMAWSQVEPVTKAKPTELTQFHYGDEVNERIQAYQNLINAVDSIQKNISFYRTDAFYQLVYYPVVAAASINHKWLYAYKNKFVASQGRASSFFYGEKSLQAYNRIVLETKYYNSLNEGKWNHIMNMSPRYLPVFERPSISVAYPNNNNELGLALEGYEMEMNNKTVNSFADVLPVFNAYNKNSYYVDVFLKGEGNLKWEAKPKNDWVKISKTSGELNGNKQEERLWVTIDWNKVPKGEDKKEAPLGHDYQLIPPSFKVNSAIEFVSGDSSYTVGVSVFNPKLKELEGYKGFVEDKGFVSINAENYTRKKEGAEAKWQTFEGLGYTNNVITALPRTAKSQKWISDIINNSPVLEYDFYAFNFGEVDVNIQAIPTHAFYEGRGVRCAVAIDEGKPVIVDFETLGRSEAWKQNVLKNATVKTAKQIVNKAGKHTLKIWMVDPGVMIDQVLIDLGGWKHSYAFPKETKL